MNTLLEIHIALRGHASELALTFGHLSVKHPPYDPDWPALERNFAHFANAWKDTTLGHLDDAKTELDAIAW
jgi:hypothetical protein